MLATIGIMTACSDDIFAPAYTVGEADNAIVLHAGISEGGSGVQTRAAGGYDDIDATNHAKHLTFAEGTKAALRIDGDWWKQGDDHATPISQTTTATIGAETDADSKHNSLSMSPLLYWDDYGTADPANTGAGKGREKGLSIYGAAVDGEETAPTVGSWTAMAWNVGDGSTGDLSQTSGWSDYDLLVSNNIKVGGLDDTYKFDEKASGKLLEFTHAMSKITVRLIASDGFPTTGVGATATKFATTPEVKLTSNETGQSNAEWAYTSGNVNVESGEVTGQGNAAIITMRTQSTTDANYTVIYDALVVPGSTFGAASGSPAEYPTIARINADGNIYYVTSEKIRAAITTKYGSGNELGFATQPGVNYIITVTISKTRIVVTATIKDWIDVVADPETPKINVTANVGAVSVDENTKQRMPSFDFYLSDAAGGSPTTAYTRSATATKPSEGADGASAWTFTPTLYWPNHTTHYLMRGVSPTLTTVAAGKIAVAADDYSDLATAAGNLLVGAPEIADNTMCGNADHTQVDMATGGICAREGKINLTFDYMMSQLEVHLTTSSDAAAVNLTNAKVEVVGGYIEGTVDIHTKMTATTGEKTDFTVNYITGEDANYRHSFVVPQILTYSTPRAESNLRFKVTIYKDGDPAQGVDDIYYADIKPIQVSIAGSEKQSITTWEKGKHYIYVLDINKTAINTTATITDWVTVTASDNVWF